MSAGADLTGGHLCSGRLGPGHWRHGGPSSRTVG